MDLLTVVFTGLIIFDGGGHVDLVKANHHKPKVYVNNTLYEVNKSLSFKGLDPGKVSPTLGFELPDLKDIFTPGPLSVNTHPDKVIRLQLFGGTTSPFESYARCTVNKKSILFWQGLRWRVTVPNHAKIVIDDKEYAIDNKTTVHVSNDYTGDGKDERSHVPMYEGALNQAGHVTLHMPECDAPFSAMKEKEQVGVRTNNPITCPPVRLP